MQSSIDLERNYRHLFDFILINDNLDIAFERLEQHLDDLLRNQQWVPVTWLYWGRTHNFTHRFFYFVHPSRLAGHTLYRVLTGYYISILDCPSNSSDVNSIFLHCIVASWDCNYFLSTNFRSLVSLSSVMVCLSFLIQQIALVSCFLRLRFLSLCKYGPWPILCLKIASTPFYCYTFHLHSIPEFHIPRCLFILLFTLTAVSSTILLCFLLSWHV